MTTNNDDINVANNVAQRNSQDSERVADTSKTIVVEKEVFEAVLRNSVKVADLEAENMQLKDLLKDVRNLWNGTVFMPTSQQQVQEVLNKIDEVLK